jgi:hypothetical protein
LTVPIALTCDMTAIPASERPAHHELTRRLVAGSTIRETAGGFEFELPADEFEAAARFVARERLCCPFLDFRIEAPAGRGALRLLMTGPAGAKAFIRSELHLPDA